MTKQEQIQFFKEQLRVAKDLELVARQSLNTAIRLGSEAQASLDKLGANPGRPQKGNPFTEAELIELKASLYR